MSEPETVVEGRVQERKRKRGVKSAAKQRNRKNRQKQKKVQAAEDARKAAAEAEAPEGPVEGMMVDSHFHLDRTLHKFRLRSVQELERRVRPEVQLQYMVAVACDPQFWEKAIVQCSSDRRVFYTLGWHPKHCMSKLPDVKRVEEMMEMAKEKRCVALGEVGLDQSHHLLDSETVDCGRCRMQRDSLVLLLKEFVKTGMPIIFHCRGPKRSSGQRVFQELLDVCQEVAVPKATKLVLHSFSADEGTAQTWLKEFPYLYLGMSPLCGRPSYHGTLRKVVETVSLDRVLPETDAPYMDSQGHSHPWNVVRVVDILARALLLPEDHIKLVTRLNACAFYSLPWVYEK